MNPLCFFLDLLYPPKCPFCGRILERNEEGWCVSCQEELPWTKPGDAKTVEFCGLCLSPLWYQDGVRKGIHRCKFGGVQSYTRQFAVLMAQCLQDRWEEPVDLITWAPLHAKRRRERGYDQAELLARHVGGLTGLPVERTLEKTRATALQSQAGEDVSRRANVRGAYRVLPGLDLTGKRIVLVDDVVTSGATLSECAAALRQAGAGSTVGLTLARAR